MDVEFVLAAIVGCMTQGRRSAGRQGRLEGEANRNHIPLNRPMLKEPWRTVHEVKITSRDRIPDGERK
jgi:hypothetical protein